MTYDEALQFWFGRVNYEQRTPRRGDLRLDRMRALLDRLGNPQEGLRVIHVAGSKGKGSTSAMLAAVLRQAGYRTGLFTSPHLCEVTERIQTDGRPVSRAELAGLMDRVAPVVACLDEERLAGTGVTFFEIATALGLLHFAEQGVDLAVLEVGLGGRLDATNVCRPLVAVITSISLDHTKQLGNTLASIAREKAGIIKPGRPTVSGVRDPEPRAVIERIARERESPLTRFGADFHYDYEPAQVASGGHPGRVTVTTARRRWPAFDLGLTGEHQAANAAVTVAVLEELREMGLAVGDDEIAQGLRHVHWPARMEVLRREPLALLDCAHNPASARALVEALAASFPLAGDARRLLVFASSQDKDVRGMLEVLAPHFTHVYLTRFDNPRCTPAEGLASLLRAGSPVEHTVCGGSAEAWRLALAAARPQDLICVTGSVFLAGELRPVMAADAALFPG